MKKHKYKKIKDGIRWYTGYALKNGYLYPTLERSIRQTIMVLMVFIPLTIGVYYLFLHDDINAIILNLIDHKHLYSLELFGLNVPLSFVHDSYHISVVLIAVLWSVLFFIASMVNANRNRLELHLLSTDASVEEIITHGRYVHKHYSVVILKSITFLAHCLIYYVLIWSVFLLLI